MAKHVAIKRLLADLKEVLEHPQLDAVARPLDANLFIWHANLRLPETEAVEAEAVGAPAAEDGQAAPAQHLAGVPVHAVLVFPETYPTDGPEVRLFHALPHPNVYAHLVPREESQGAAYRVALWDCNPSIDQWCPAYSVSSTLALLHSFLLDPALLYDTNKITHERARRAALALEVEGHPHRGSSPFPPFPVAEELALAPRLRQLDVRRPAVNKELMAALPEVAPGAGKAALADADGWVAVGAKGMRSRRAAGEAEVAGAAAAAGALPGGFALLESLGEAEEASEMEEEASAEAEEDEAAAVEEGAAAGSTCSTGSAAGGSAKSALSLPGRRKRLLDDSILRCPQRSLIADVMALYRRRQASAAAGGRGGRAPGHADAITGAAEHRQAAAEGASAGPLFNMLPPDALAQVLMRMEARDVAALGATCRALRAACSDGEVWRCLLRRAFPASPLVCADLADYQLAYQVEANGVVPELSCFYSRAPCDSEVLGFAYQFTTNPKTGLVDYCLPTSPDLVSIEAVQAGLVRRDAGGQDVMGALPAYITAEHFQRAQPLLPAVLRQLCPREYAPGPDTWLTVLPTMLNTVVVLLCDHGTAASERALNTYCGLHRLLLALCDRHALWERAERRVGRFLSQEVQRTKGQAPNLGQLVPLLALSRRHDWREVLPVILGESLDRQVLWACKADRSLIDRYRVDPERGGVDLRLMAGAFEASRVSLRLLMFHAAFLRLVARPEGQSLGEVMFRLDCLYGRPGAGLRARFQGEVKRILACRGWDEALELMGLAMLTPAAWTARLRQAWLNSLAKGYHTRRTNWDRIQAGGVSRILLRGQQYSAPPNLAFIEVDERWRSSRRFGFTYLDASCLLYGRRRGAPPMPPLERLDVVDYCHTRSRDGRGAVEHSGDLIEGDAGQHTLRICLRTLPAGVECLFLVMSTFAGAMLNEVEQPYICVRDPASGVELCQFHLDDVPAAQRAANSAVVMLKVFRGGVAGRWEIQAIGHVGAGAASNYGPIDAWIVDGLNAQALGPRRR
ncbi:hypothetical protein ABPG75_000710 [Micractinium tetrahymenae]